MIDLVWLAVLLPFLGFLANGWLAFTRPKATVAVSAIGVGVLVAAFLVAVGVALAFAGGHHAEPIIVPLWSWLPVGDLDVALAFQVDPLTIVMLLAVTVVSSTKWRRCWATSPRSSRNRSVPN